MTQPTFLVIDLFCGFGGTTLGFSRAQIQDEPVAKVLACVNHDPKAINSHLLNHPEVHHFTEDIRTLELSPLVELVRKARIQYPDAYVVLWASLECTNHSKAKGGLPRDADSRTLACDLFRYQEALQPDYIMIENVVEFMAWGPLDENGKPVSRKNGQDWIRWRNQMNALGYWDDWRELNSANYGSYTSRNRLFGAFARPGLPIVWPEATHSKKVRPGMFGSLKPWKAVKDVLDFSDEGKSIFDRKKPLVEKTLERIYAGLIKYVAGVEYWNSEILEHPPGVLNFVDRSVRIEGRFLYKYYGNGHNLQSVDQPCGTLTTKDRLVSVVTHFIANYKSGDPNSKVGSVENPLGTITCSPTQSLVQLETGEFGIEVYSADSPMTVKIKEFMALYGIADIRMRMLKVPELLRIQGFPDTYQMVGTQEDHKKYIGNSVEPNVVKAWVEALAGRLQINL
jgi:DNA (cytosine-5)-methyltransferase 1